MDVLYFIACFCLQIGFTTSQVQPFNSAQFQLKHLVVHPDTGDLYVGAVNRIYRLDANLNIQSEAETGPKKDNQICTSFNNNFTQCRSPEFPPTPISDTDNTNKILVIDKENNRLLTCGSVYQGTCEMRRLNSLSVATSYYNLGDPDFTLAPNTENDRYSAVAFISSGPVCDSFTGTATGSQNVLYVGSSNTNNLPQASRSSVRVNIPSVSSHNLQAQVLDLVHKSSNIFDDNNQFSRLVLKRTYSDKESNVIEYKAGFASGKFSYFLTVQPTASESSIYTSKLIQICQADCSYHSYVEIPITCSDGYNLIQTAKLVKPGLELATNLGITTNDDVLFAVFAKSSSGQGYIPGTESAVCVYKMKDIEAKVKENWEACFENGTENLADNYGRIRNNNQKCSVVSIISDVISLL